LQFSNFNKRLIPFQGKKELGQPPLILHHHSHPPSSTSHFFIPNKASKLYHNHNYISLPQHPFDWNMSEENHTLRSLQHPLDLLDQYLLNLPIPTASKTNNQQIIEISDFLYGKQNNRVSNRVHGSSNSPSPASHPPLGSILEGSLELLDSFDDPSQTLAPIRMIIAKDSGRRAIVVRGSQGGSVPEYLCTLGSVKGSKSIKRISSLGREGYHCSCRSFFERLKSDKFALCKHLLAARLAPFLCMDHEDGDINASTSIYEEETVEELEFARMYTRISLASW
jgi:hypothetical protein